jgi:putative hemolysin
MLFESAISFPKPVRRLAARVYEAIRTTSPELPIAERLLAYLGAGVAVTGADLLRVPKTGATIVVANHAFGLLDAAALATVLSRARGDVRFLANEILTDIPELRDVVLPANSRGLRVAIEHLKDGGLLVVFPAGEVSHWQWRPRRVADSRWNSSAARLATATNATVVPVYVPGRNSAPFCVAPARVRTAMLLRELLNKRGSRVEVRIGSPIPCEKLRAIPSAQEQVEYLRWRTYLLRERAAADSGEVARLTPLATTGDLSVYVARASQIPTLLRELGRLREITFRAVGEGSGKAIDLDRFDEHYLHLFVWNARREEVVGAYRLVGTDQTRDLYTKTLFRYDDRLLDRVGPALELGRSFVRAEYQKGFAPLLLLWKGIGEYIGRNPRYRVLFGPVSISDQYAAISRELMAAVLERYAMWSGWDGLVRGRNPLRRRGAAAGLPSAGVGLDDLDVILGEVEQGRAGVPVLLRQYLRLGGKLLGFNVDREFANALDGLILVDLMRTEPKLLDRYLGKGPARRFLEFQKGMYGTDESTILDELGAPRGRGRDLVADPVF